MIVKSGKIMLSLLFCPSQCADFELVSHCFVIRKFTKHCMCDKITNYPLLNNDEIPMQNWENSTLKFYT